MKRKYRISNELKWAITTIAGIVIFAWSCRKTEGTGTAVVADQQNAKAVDSPDEKNRLSYKDSVYYFQSSPKNYLVKPAKKPKGPGYFTVSPEGLEINATTGTFDVNNSEAGLRYKVYYMSPDNEAVDSTLITIAGIDYHDGIFDLSVTPEHDKAIPVYDGSTDNLPCASGTTDSSGQCIFDETDLDGDGVRDIDGANRGKLRINRKNGAIDLEQSFNDGVFGSTHPQNGIVKDFTIQYRLNDASKKALNKIKVRLYHFATRESIPTWLINELQSRKEMYEPNTGTDSSGTVVQSNSILLSPKRPPLIIIVSGMLSR